MRKWYNIELDSNKGKEFNELLKKLILMTGLNMKFQAVEN